MEAFLHQLQKSNFAGDITTDIAHRMVGATDNSIYWIAPNALAFPKNTADIQKITELGSQHDIAFTARGGATGTNAQSLNNGLVVDFSRHMTNIIDFTIAKNKQYALAVVEPGVVLDQLNNFAKPHGYFFPPNISTSSRATIGGMFATDASGQGSRIYGKTSDYVVQANVRMANGTPLCATTHGLYVQDTKKNHTTQLPNLQHIIHDIHNHATAIAKVFPNINRALTGYNLRDAITSDAVNNNASFNAIKLLAGSEGTLAITEKLTLRLLPSPSYRALCVLAYRSIQSALEHVEILLKSDPTAIEFLDDKIIQKAMMTPLRGFIESVFGNALHAGGFLFVEMTAHSKQEMQKKQHNLRAVLANHANDFLHSVHTDDAKKIQMLWNIRKQSVGLLGKDHNKKAGTAFVEDAAVPVAKLPAFVDAFRNILHQHNLEYGMFGHADVGCVHVRPMLNMMDKNDQKKIRVISDKIAVLAHQYGGLLWGEHGKGVRGEYLADYVGTKVYQLMQRVKTFFDPNNQLNPGKLVSPAHHRAIARIDSITLRGSRDADIDLHNFHHYSKALTCNGNGSCHAWAPDESMCPSYKATHDKTQGPKGRATLFREWMRTQSIQNKNHCTHIQDALYTSLTTCLGCQSCTHQCPVQVDIPSMKSHFLHQYFATHNRPLRDRIIRHMENIMLISRKRPKITNALLYNAASKYILKNLFSIVDIPKIDTPTIEKIAVKNKIHFYTPQKLIQLKSSSQKYDVCLIADGYTGTYETNIIEACIQLCKKINIRIAIVLPFVHGKAQHVYGYMEDFYKIRKKATDTLHLAHKKLGELVVIEPSIYNYFIQEYNSIPPIQTIDTLLFLHIKKKYSKQIISEKRNKHIHQKSLALFCHCTEISLDPQTPYRWKDIFLFLAQQEIQYIQTGCCGMAGIFGHQREHQKIAKKIFDISWNDPVHQHTDAMATGFSCRSQVARYTKKRLPHPIEKLQELMP